VKQPNETSSDFRAMEPYWRMMAAIMGGTASMRKEKEYLPRFPNESEQDYSFRLSNARFTNIFGDILDTLSSKPFGRELTVETKSAALTDFLEDVDGDGSHIHVFANNWFYHGIANGLDWVLVDYTSNVPENATLADEKRLGVRPYWVRLPALSVLAVYSEKIAGESVFTHVRIAENSIVRDGYDEKPVERVRIFDREVTRDDKGNPISAARPTWTILEKSDDKKNEWEKVDSGILTIPVIPLVPFISGRRKGASWVVRPPLCDAADLQIEHYQQESALKYAKDATAFPMLAGNGVTPPLDGEGKPEVVPVGPKTVLYAPPNSEGQSGSWDFIEPSAESLRFLSEDLDKTEKSLRELGRQPLTAQSGNITTITAAFAGDKAHSVIEAWALNNKDALEKALSLTSMWLKEDADAKVDLDTDFSLDLKDENGGATLKEMREGGDLSQETLWEEQQRRGILGPNFDADREAKRLLGEVPGDEEGADMDVLGAGTGSDDPQASGGTVGVNNGTENS